MFYVISAPVASDLLVERDTLVQWLAQGWPGVVIEFDRSLPTRDVVWRIAMPEGELEGSQDREGEAQYLDGPIATVVRYAQWLRQQVPESQALVLYDETYSTVIPLDPGTAEEDLLVALR